MHTYIRLTSSGWMQLGNNKDLTLLYSHSYNGICAHDDRPTLRASSIHLKPSSYSGSQRTARTREPAPQDPAFASHPRTRLIVSTVSVRRGCLWQCNGPEPCKGTVRASMRRLVEPGKHESDIQPAGSRGSGAKEQSISRRASEDSGRSRCCCSWCLWIRSEPSSESPSSFWIAPGCPMEVAGRGAKQVEA